MADAKLTNDTQGAEWLACAASAWNGRPATTNELAEFADKLYAEYRKRRDGG